MLEIFVCKMQTFGVNGLSALNRGLAASDFRTRKIWYDFDVLMEKNLIFSKRKLRFLTREYSFFYEESISIYGYGQRATCSADLEQAHV